MGAVLGSRRNNVNGAPVIDRNRISVAVGSSSSSGESNGGKSEDSYRVIKAGDCLLDSVRAAAVGTGAADQQSNEVSVYYSQEARYIELRPAN